MGWATDLYCNITFNRKTYNTIYEVQNDIDELKEQIRICKNELQSLVYITEPEKFYDKSSYTSPMDWINTSFQENMEALEEYYIELYKLELLEENWNHCHTKEGLAIPHPDNIHWDSAFLDGDFVNTIKNNKNENTIGL